MQHLTDSLPTVPPFVLWIVGGIVAAVLIITGLRWAYRYITTRPLEDVLTIVAAGIATAVSASGMWQFFARIMPDVAWGWRAVMFAFIEVAVVTSAVRAKRSMKEKFSAGVDGVAVWTLTCVSAVLSAMEAASFPEAVFRLAAPLVAAWLWERGMAIERHRATGLSGINWRVTPERVLVRLGLAEAKDRTASEVDTHRRLIRVALAAKKARTLRQAGASDRKMRTAMGKLDRALDRAVEHTGLARDQVIQAALLDQVSTLYGGASLLDLPEVAPWQHLDHPAVTGAGRNSEADRLAGELRAWTEAIEREHDPEVSAAVTSMAAYISGRHLPATGSATSAEVAPEVAELVAGQVALARPIPSPRGPETALTATRSATSTATATDTPSEVAEEVAPEVADDDLVALINALQDDMSDTGDATATATKAATDAMWRYWNQVIEEEHRIPTGAELAREGDCADSYGRRMRGIWEKQLDGRIRRGLRGATKKVGAS